MTPNLGNAFTTLEPDLKKRCKNRRIYRKYVDPLTHDVINDVAFFNHQPGVEVSRDRMQIDVKLHDRTLLAESKKH